MNKYNENIDNNKLISNENIDDNKLISNENIDNNKLISNENIDNNKLIFNENIDNKKNNINECDVNNINDENIISFCIKNILESTLKENINNENFIEKKNEELNEYVNKHSLIHLNNYDKDNLDEFINNEEKSINLINNDKMFNDFDLYEENKNKKRKNKKRKYLDINKFKLDYDEKDLNSNSYSFFPINTINEKNNIDDITYNDNVNNLYDQTYEINKHISNNCIDIENEIIKKLIHPPKIPFNENFQKINKEVSELYLNSKENKNKLNIFLLSQINCIETEKKFEEQNYFINNNFNNFILNKLNILNSHDQKIYENKSLEKLLEYLMSWYFAGFYTGKMSVIK